MVLLSDFLQSFVPSVLLKDYSHRLNYYFLGDDGSYRPIELAGYSYIDGKYYYHFRLVPKGPSLFSMSERECRYTGVIAVRPKRAFRTWFEEVLLPY